MSLEEKIMNSDNEESSDNDSDFSVSEMKKGRKNRSKRSKKRKPKVEVQQRMILRPRTQNMEFPIDEESEDESEEESFQLPELRVFKPNIESLHSERWNKNKKEYFVKFQNYSFQHCQWMEEDEIIGYDSNMKKKLKRFVKDFEAFSESGKKSCFLNYDSKFAKVDRIITCSELFPVIHPKKASLIKNQWCEKLLDIIRLLTNFENRKVFYGVHFLNLCDIYSEYKEIQENIDFSVIINRLYLDDYKAPSSFWKDILQVYQNFEAMNHHKTDNDRGIIIYRLKEITKCCFRNWKIYHKNKLEDIKVFFRAKYSENEFNEFLADFYKMFSIHGNNNSGKFLTRLKALIEKNKTFLPNFEKIQLLFIDLKNKGTFLQKLLNSKNKTEDGEGKEDFENPDEDLDNSEEDEEAILKSDVKMEEEEIELKNDSLVMEKSSTSEQKIASESPADKQELEIKDQKESEKNDPIDKNEKLEQNEIKNDKASIPIELTAEDFEIEKEKAEFKKVITEIQILINQNIEYFQILFKNVKNPHLKTIYGPLDADLGILLEEGPIDLSWVESAEDKMELMNFTKKYKEKYFIKWKNLSFLNSTWENEEVLEEYPEKLKNFHIFNRALLKDARKEYLERFEINLQLAEIKSNTKKFSRQHPSHIFELRKKLFGFKEMKNIFQYQPKNQPVYKDKKRLRDYQLESLNWMIKAWTKRRNIILADEMGLGKTIQAMSFINHLVFVEKLAGPFLIIAPLSTLQHWKRVFLEWSYLNTILYYDNNGKSGRTFCRENEWYRYDVTQKGNFTKHYKITKFQVLITSFEVFIQDFDIVFQEIPFQHIIIDEAHRLKNKNAKIISMLRRLVCNRIFLLTGTPIQNNITELWSLLNFIEPNQFDDLNKFKEKFDDLTLCDQLENLKTALKPYLLRRMKEDVETSIPPLTETIIDIELTNIQKMVYKTVYEKSKGTLQKGLGLKFVSMMNNLEIQLRKCCNHPFLLNGIKENLLDGVVTNNDYFEKILNCSGKMIFLDKMVMKFQKENKKILIFSQFTEMLKIIEEYLNFKSIHYEKIDGSTKAKDRQGAIDRFNNAPNFFEVFLLSTKAGGIGINLTSAKIVIIYDSDWNPQNDVQAIARAHRIGQTEEVSVFRMVSKKTYESEMFERSSKKLGLDQAIFLSKTFTTSDNNGPNDEMLKLKPKEIELLLRKGMLGLLEEENGKQEELYDMDIDEVIKNARVANYSFTKGSYSFAKGNFNTTSKENKVLLDDPDFWQKVFINSDTAADKITRKYEELKKNKLIKILNNQKEFFFELSAEIFDYMTERMKNEGYCEVTERKFNELLQKMEDSSDFHPIISEVIHQLAIDFKKQSRRIKKYDEKFINALFRKRMKTDRRRPLKVVKKKDADELQDEENEDLRERLEEDYMVEEDENNMIFHEASDYEKDYKIKKKKNKLNTLTLCDICFKENPDFTCEAFCARPFHRTCLEEKLKAMSPEIQAVKTAEKIQEKEEKDNVCDFCRDSIAQCFDCKKLSKVENQGKITDLKHEKSQNFLYKCNLCRKFYHLRCLTKEKITIKKKKFTCAAHICNDCGEQSNELYYCQECPMSFHKKCLSKRNRILSDNLILCYNHKKNRVQKVKSKKSNGKKPLNSFNNILTQKRNRLIEESSKPSKKLKISTNKKSTDYYKQFNLEHPDKFDYSKYDKV